VTLIEIIGLIVLIPLGIVSAFVVAIVLAMALIDLLDRGGRE
jgi:hypothetical protein